MDDKPNARGEIIIGCDMVAAGYYKNEKDTGESFFKENGTRWWRSGNIGGSPITGQELNSLLFEFSNLFSNP